MDSVISLPFAYNSSEIFLRVMKATNSHGREAFIMNGVDLRWVPWLDRLIPREVVDEVVARRGADGVTDYVEYPLGSDDRTCIYCNGRLTSDHELDDYEACYVYNFYYDSREHFDQFFRDLRLCPNCGWWWVEMRRGLVTSDDFVYEHFETYHVRGVLRHFDVTASDASLEDLVGWLRRNEESISEVDPFRFEDLISECFKERLGANAVRKIGGRQDRGIDLILIESEKDPVFVQIKRRSNRDSTEGVATVRTLNGMLLEQGQPHGMIITTAMQFSPATIAAIDDVRRNNPDGKFSRYRVDLWSYQDVIQLLHGSLLDKRVFTDHVWTPTFDEWIDRWDPDARTRTVP